MTSLVKSSEPPSQLQPPLFMIGQDGRGNWVVQDQNRLRGGLFVNSDAALRFVRAENDYQPRAVVMVSGNLELEIDRAPGAPRAAQAPLSANSARRIA
jgi:hypothetical protein